jgi:DNA-directed RNA polymerase subunit RPC12/RpoP
MFTYAYHCLECGKNFEIKATLREKEENHPQIFQCPNCISTRIKERFSIINFIRNIGVKNETCGCSGGSCAPKDNCCDSKSNCCEPKDGCCGQ